MAKSYNKCPGNEMPVTDLFQSTGYFPENLSTGKKSRESEKKLLLCCSRADFSEKNVPELNELLSGPLDWKFVSEVARSGNISQLLYYNLKGLPNGSPVPLPVMEDLERAYRETCARNMLLFAELRTILDAFRLAGSKAIVLKGAALAGIVYPDIGLRPMLDIDLLVKKDELSIADKIMTNLDYAAVHGSKPQKWHMKNHFHLPPYRHAWKPVIVEIHWRVTMGSSSNDIDRWWERAVVRDNVGYRIPVPSPEDMLTHLSLHLFNHGYDNGFALRGLCDIFEVLRHYRDEIDWKMLQDEMKMQGIEKQVHSMLYLVRELYAVTDDAFVPIDLDHADHRFLHALKDSLFADSSSSPVNPYILKYMMFDNLPGKIIYLLSKIFPSRQEMADRYPASPSSIMIFFYYFVRPFHLLAKYGRSAARMYRSKSGGKQ